MGKWISVAVAVVLTGCGLDPNEAVGTKMPALQDGQRDLVSLAQPSAVEHKPTLVAAPSVAAQVTRKTVDVTVKLTGILGAEGQSIRVVLGQLGCGFSEIASASGAVEHGMAVVRLPDLPAVSGGGDLLVFLDSDADGQCTEADAVWMTALSTQGFNSTVTIDLGKLEQAASWACFAFSRG